MASTKRLRKQEARLESPAVRIRLGPYLSFIEAVRGAGLPVEWSSFTTKKNGQRVDVTVHASDIFNGSLWEKFLKWRGSTNAQLIRLTDAVALAEEFCVWLLSEYKSRERYYNLNLDGQMWLKKIATMAVEWHILDNKADGLASCTDPEDPDEDYWMNEHVGNLYEIQRIIRNAPKAVARPTHHIMKNPENKELGQELVSKYYDNLNHKIVKNQASESDDVAETEEYWENEERKEVNRLKHDSNGETGEAAI